MTLTLKAIIALFIIGEGPVALITALMFFFLRKRIHTVGSAISGFLTVWFIAIAITKAASLINAAVNAKGAILPESYLFWTYFISGFEALLIWGALFLLIIYLLKKPRMEA